MSGGERHPRFEEQAALRELENLQRAIEESRQRRKRANEAFDEFVQSFDSRRPAASEAVPPRSLPPKWTPPEALPSASDAVPPSAPPGPARPVAPPMDSSPLPPRWIPPEGAKADLAAFPAFTPPAFTPSADLPGPPSPILPPEWTPPEAASLDPQADVVSPPPLSEPAAEAPRAVPAALTRTPSEARRFPPAAGAAAVVVLGLALVFAWRAGRPDEAPPAPVTVLAPSPPPPARVEPAAPVPAGLLSTTRRVWVRVLVDGVKTVEQELPADTRMPLAASSEIVIRAGDAGAVRIAIRGVDQGPLGPAGQITTKAYKVR